MEIDSTQIKDAEARPDTTVPGASRKQISKADIARLADVAKREQVMVEMEFGGRIVRVSPLPAGEYGGASFARRGGVVL